MVCFILCNPNSTKWYVIHYTQPLQRNENLCNRTTSSASQVCMAPGWGGAIQIHAYFKNICGNTKYICLQPENFHSLNIIDQVGFEPE